MFIRVTYGRDHGLYNYSEFIADSEDDLVYLPTSKYHGTSGNNTYEACSIGSKVYTLSDNRTYILGNENEWVLYTSAASEDSGGGASSSGNMCDNFFADLVPANKITANTDLNNVTVAGVYRWSSIAVGSTLLNTPANYGDYGSTLIVAYIGAGNNNIMQILITYLPNVTSYSRICYRGSWYEWQKYESSNYKVKEITEDNKNDVWYPSVKAVSDYFEQRQSQMAELMVASDDVFKYVIFGTMHEITANWDFTTGDSTSLMPDNTEVTPFVKIGNPTYSADGITTQWNGAPDAIDLDVSDISKWRFTAEMNDSIRGTVNIGDNKVMATMMNDGKNVVEVMFSMQSAVIEGTIKKQMYLFRANGAVAYSKVPDVLCNTLLVCEYDKDASTLKMSMFIIADDGVVGESILQKTYTNVSVDKIRLLNNAALDVGTRNRVKSASIQYEVIPKGVE